MFLGLSGSHLQNGSSSSHVFLLGVVPPPHFRRQKLSIKCCDHTHNFVLNGDAMHACAGGRALSRTVARRGGTWYSLKWESMLRTSCCLVWTCLVRLQGLSKDGGILSAFFRALLLHAEPPVVPLKAFCFMGRTFASSDAPTLLVPFILLHLSSPCLNSTDSHSFLCIPCHMTRITWPCRILVYLQSN